MLFISLHKICRVLEEFKISDFPPNILVNWLPFPVPVPVPGSWEQYFLFPFPFPNVGNSISNSRSRSQMLGTVFQIPVPVPECTKVIPAHACQVAGDQVER